MEHSKESEDIQLIVKGDYVSYYDVCGLRVKVISNQDGSCSVGYNLDDVDL